MGIIGVAKEFIAGRGFTLMLFGISAAAAGVLLYAFLNTPRYAASGYPQAAVGLAVLGFAVYFVGRVSVAMQRNENKRKAKELLNRDDDAIAEPPNTHDASAEFLPRNDNESGVK